MEEYLKTLDMSELITYLEIEKQPGNFKKVEKILVSREKKMASLKENLEIYQAKCSDLTTALEANREKNVIFEGKCTELIAALEAERRKNAGMELKLAEFENLKMANNKLGERVMRLEEECRVVGERERAAVRDAAVLLEDLDKVAKSRLVEFDELKAKNEVLERGLQKAAGEFGQLQARNELLETGIRLAGEEIETQKRRQVELEKMVKHVNDLERDLKIHKRYKGISEELEQKVMRLENERNIISGKEKSAREKIISLLGGAEKEKSEKERITKLMDDLEKVSRKRQEELVELKGKYQDLEYAKQKAEDEITAQKKMRMELETTAEKTTQRLKELEEDLRMHKGYKTVCSELEEKVSHLERDCKNLSDKEKNAKERIANLLSDLEKEKSGKERVSYLLGDLENLNAQLISMNTKLENSKKKVDGELEAQKKKYEELEKSVQQSTKQTTDLEKEMEIYKAKCSEFSEKISKKKDEKLMELQMKIKDLEDAKQKAEDEIEAQKEKCKNMEKAMKNTNELEKDLEVYKVKCSELSVALEEKKIGLDKEAMLKKFSKYKAFCDEFREKVARLDECEVVPERKKAAKKRTNNVSSILEVVNGDKNDELIGHNRDLDFVKLKDKPKERKKKHKKLETAASQSAASQSAASQSAASQLNDEKLALVCKPQIQVKANGDDVPNIGGKDHSTLGNAQSETVGGMNGSTCAAKLKIRLKPLNCICEGRVCDAAGAGSICHSAVKGSGSGHVEVPIVKRKQKRKSLNSDGGVDGDHTRRDKLKKDASGNQVPVISHDVEQSLDPSLYHEKKDVGDENTPLKTSEPSSHHASSPRKDEKTDGAEKTLLKTSEPSSHHTNSPKRHEKKDVGAEKTPLKTSESSNHDTNSARKNEKKDAGAEKTPSKTSDPSETSVEKSANSISENDKEKPKTTEGKSRRIVHPPNRLNL